MGLTLYKYVPKIYAERFLAKGEVLFRSLSYFLACEHDERGDDTEGIRVYEPARGLEITKQTGERGSSCRGRFGPASGSRITSLSFRGWRRGGFRLCVQRS